MRQAFVIGVTSIVSELHNALAGIGGGRVGIHNTFRNECEDSAL